MGALGEGGSWGSATERIVKMISGGADTVEGLPAGYGTSRLVESYARQFEEDYGVELGMSFPALLAGLSGATQGGFVAPMLQKITAEGPQFVWTPLVMQFIGIAEAGQSKSTLLNEIQGPLRRALDRVAAEDRRFLVDAAKKKAMKEHGDIGNTVDTNPQTWDQVYNGGLCTSSVTDQGTQEGIRNNLIRQGGHRVILTAEPDVLREISAYQGKSGGSGSLGLMLRGWGQEDLSVDRANVEGLYVREPSLPFVIMLQPESFAEYTSGAGGRDEFVGRGVFSRTLLCHAERTPVLDQWADDWESLLTPVKGAKPLVNPLMVMREKYADRLEKLALRTNAYRVTKGIEQSWAESKAALWMKRPAEVERERLPLEPGIEALRVHIKVQQMRDALRRAVREADALNPGLATLLDPMAVRFTDHVMRLAALLSLADDAGATAVDTAHMEDVATRLMPWLWASWWRVMHDRLEENGRTFVETQTLKNPKGINLSGGVKLLRAIVKLESKAGIVEASVGFLPSAIFKIASVTMPTRSGNNPYFRAELKRLVADGLVEEVPGSQTVNAAGNNATARYRITALGRTEVTEQVS